MLIFVFTESRASGVPMQGFASLLEPLAANDALAAKQQAIEAINHTAMERRISTENDRLPTSRTLTPLRFAAENETEKYFCFHPVTFSSANDFLYCRNPSDVPP